MSSIVIKCLKLKEGGGMSPWWKPMDKLSVYVLWKTRNFLFSHSSLQNGNLDLFMVYRMEPWNFYSLRSTERETEIFPVYGLKPGKFSGLHNRNQNFSGIPDQGFGKQEKFRFLSHPEISRNFTSNFLSSI